MPMTTQALFLNLSNHSTSKWSAKQIDAAKVAAKAIMGADPEAEVVIINIPFPQVDPSAMPWEVEKLAKEVTAAAVYDNADALTSSIVFHIMGEQSFCYHAFKAVEELGYHACVSTTDRKVVEKQNEDGTTVKTAVFEFVQFRPVV